MENKDVNLEEIKEGVQTVSNEVSNGNNNMIIALAAGIFTITVGLGVGGYMLLKKHRKNQTEIVLTETISDKEAVKENNETAVEE